MSEIKELDRNLRALANKRRLAILKYLKRTKKASVSDIAEKIKLSFRATSRHLGVLSSAGILEKEQEGLVMWHEIGKGVHSVVSDVLRHL